MRHNKNRTALGARSRRRSTSCVHAVVIGTGLVLAMLFGASRALACGDTTPDPTSTPPVQLVLAI